jgi:hypothetical protein
VLTRHRSAPDRSIVWRRLPGFCWPCPGLSRSQRSTAT